MLDIWGIMRLWEKEGAKLQRKKGSRGGSAFPLLKEDGGSMGDDVQKSFGKLEEREKSLGRDGLLIKCERGLGEAWKGAQAPGRKDFY